MRDRLKAISQRHPRLVAFFFVYYLALLAYGVVSGMSQTAFYALFVAAGALLVAALDHDGRFSSLVLWGLASWGAAHMIGGLVDIDGQVIYERSLGAGEFRFDKVVHFFGFGFATLASYELLRKTVASNASPRSIAIVALLVGLGVGAVNETIEFLITLLPLESNVGGFSNTGWDLVANALGAMTACLVAPMLERRSPRP